MNEVAYTPEAPDNPNFVSRPPDPGYLRLYGTVGWDALYHSPFSGTYRMSQLGLESSDYFNVDGNLLTPEQANSKYGMHGQLKFDEPVKESAAQLMMQRKIDENDRNYVIGSGMTSGFRQAAGIGVGMAATLLDPINFASMFVPVVGEARYARMVQRFGGSVLKARLAAGAIEGATGAAMVEPFVLLPALQEQANYDLKDSAANLGYGAVLGGLLHAGFGAIGDRLKKLKPRESDAMLEAAMNNVLKDEPVTSPAKIAEFTDPERVISAAVRTPDGRIIVGNSHPEIIAEHGGKAWAHGTELQQGFLTNRGQFLNREEASQFALQTGQMERGHLPISEINRINKEAVANPEKIVAAAIQLDDGTILTGPNHPKIIMDNPKHFGDNFDLSTIAGSDGFITSAGRYISREEAFAIAQHQKQIFESDYTDAGPNLAAEDLNLPDARKLPEGFDIMAGTVDRLKQLDQIPRRDPVTGRFLSKEQRLQLLQEKIDSNKIRADNQSRVEQRGSSIDRETKTDIPRLDKEQMKSPSETPRLLTDIEKETTDLEKSLFGERVSLDDEARIDAEAMKQQFEQQMKTEIGDPIKRQNGVQAATECIVRNLI